MTCRFYVLKKYKSSKLFAKIEKKDVLVYGPAIIIACVKFNLNN
jgi:hypothetical protein